RRQTLRTRAVGDPAPPGTPMEVGARHGRQVARAMSRPVRLLVTSAYTDLGGGETSLLSTLTSLDRRRVHPLLLTRAEGQLSAAARARGLDVDILPYRGASIWFVPGIWERMPAAKRLAARIRALAVDVVCTDFHTLPYAAAGCRAAGI